MHLSKDTLSQRKLLPNDCEAQYVVFQLPGWKPQVPPGSSQSSSALPARQSVSLRYLSRLQLSMRTVEQCRQVL